MAAFDEYHDLAARLLGRGELPLPLPEWNRNYPHNIGLLSDADESELAAMVLNHTNGMSYESWRLLDLEQRLPWIRVAVERSQPEREGGHLSKAEVLLSLADRVRTNMPIVEADEVLRWPSGLLEELIATHALKVTENAKSVACDVCGHDHVESVEYIESPLGSGLRAYISCPAAGRVPVSLARLRRWTVNPERVPSASDQQSPPMDKSDLPNNVTHTITVTSEFLPTPSADDPKGLRDAADYCRAQATKLGDARAKWWWVQAKVFDEAAATAETATRHPAQTPHSLAVAHAVIIDKLASAEELYRRTLRFPKPRPVLDAIERFVYEITLVPAWYAELQHRSSLVRERCSTRSSYNQLRQQALLSHTGLPAVRGSAKMALELLQSPNTEHPQFLQEVIDVRKSIESLLADSTAGLSPQAITAFESWREACRGIQLDGERLHVDGCWYLFHVYQSAGSSPSEQAQAAREILLTNMGGTHLGELRLATDSMMAWIGQFSTRAPESKVAINGFEPIAQPPKRRTKAALRSWTQPDLNAAIGEYKAKRASTYRDLVDGVRAGRPGAKKAAQKMFGRNAIARELEVKARAMVSKSPEWQAVAEELQLSRGKNRNLKKAQKIGLDIAVEEHATENLQPVLEVAIQNETIRLIQSTLPKSEAAALVDKLRRGVTTDDQAREIVEVVKDQKRDSQARKVRNTP